MPLEAEDTSPTIIHPKKPRSIARWPFFVILAVGLFLYLFLGMVYRHSLSFPVRAVSAVIPVPAALVNGSFVTYHEVVVQADLRTRFVGEETPPSDTLFLDALDAAIFEEIGRQLADELDVSVSKEELRAAETRAQGDLTDEEFASELKDQLGMSRREFSKTVLASYTLMEELAAAVLSSTDIQAPIRERAEAAKDQLDAGENFMSVWSGAYAASPIGGGEMGYYTADSIPEHWDALLTLPEGEHSDVIETPTDFIILRVVALVGSEADPQIQTQAMVFPKRTLEDEIAAFTDQSRIIYIVKVEEV